LTNSNSTSNATDLKAKAKTQNSQLPVTPIGDEILFDGGRFVFVNINNSNCVIALQGSITRDTSRKFSNVVAIAKSRNCDKPLLLLESGGGLLDDGIMMAREVKASGYKTIVRKSCASACSMIFLGGSERTLYSKNARIGFHQPRTNLSCDEYDFDKSIKQMSRFLKYALPENYEEILGLITKTSCDSMTWVSGEEAISMGVATKIEAPNLKLEIPSGEKIQK
jgi:ATP-dependent protease ClpP protease subunit